MEESSTTKEATRTQGSAVYISYSPCSFVQAFKAFLRCLGIESISQESCSVPEQRDDCKACQTSCTATTTTTTDPEADPPTVKSDDPPPSESLRMAARRRPSVSSVSGGQIN